MAQTYFGSLSRLQLASANRVAALTSRGGILWVQGIPDVKKRYRESIENAYYRLNKGCRRDKFVIRSVTDVLRTQSRFVKCVGGSASPPTNFTNLLWARSTSETDLITNRSTSVTDLIKNLSRQQPWFSIILGIFNGVFRLGIKVFQKNAKVKVMR